MGKALWWKTGILGRSLASCLGEIHLLVGQRILTRLKKAPWRLQGGPKGIGSRRAEQPWLSKSRYGLCPLIHRRSPPATKPLSAPQGPVFLLGVKSDITTWAMLFRVLRRYGLNQCCAYTGLNKTMKQPLKCNYVNRDHSSAGGSWYTDTLRNLTDLKL